MKRVISAILTIILVLAAAATVLAMDDFSVLMQIGNPTVSVTKSGAEEKTEIGAAPQIINDLTYVPARFITEIMGGEIGFIEGERRVDIMLNGIDISMWIEKNETLVNNRPQPASAPPLIVNGWTLVPARFVSENLGLHVNYEPENKVVSLSTTVYDVAALKAMSAFEYYAAKPATVREVPVEAPVVAEKTNPQNAVAYAKKTVNGVSANVLTVDLSNSDISVEMKMVDNKLNHTAAFSSLVNTYNPIAMVNGNFFNAYDAIKDPVGNLMSNGEMLYATAGVPSMGITADNKLYFDRPGFFTDIVTTDNNGKPQVTYTCFEINVAHQAGNAVMYTPARGSSVGISASGMLMVVENGVIRDYHRVSPGGESSVPSNGFIVFFDDEITSTSYYQVPEIGRSVSVKYRLWSSDNKENKEAGFPMESIRQIVSGAPKLVTKGQLDTSPIEEGFAGDSRFSTSSTARTAVGLTADNKLLLVSASCRIDELKALMLGLGCVEAINIDGGGSCAMYHNGVYYNTPGRELTSVLMIMAK